jgi:WD40 repeat protein
VWNVTDGTSRVFVHASAITAVAFRGDGQVLATGGDDGSMTVWDMATGAQLKRLSGGACPLLTLLFSPNGSRLVANASDHSIVAWDTASYERQFGARTGQGCSGELSNWPNSLGLSPDGTLIASAPSGHEVELWSASTGQRRGALTDPSSGSHAFHVRSLVFSPRQPLVVAAAGERLLTWRLGDNTTLSTSTSPFEVDGVTFTDDGRFLLAASRRGAASLWSVDAGSSELSLVLSLGVWNESSGFVRAPDGRVQFLGSGARNAVCVLGARVYPMEICQDDADAGVLRRALSVGAQPE